MNYRVTLTNGQIIATDDHSVMNLRMEKYVAVDAIVAGNTKRVFIFAHAVAMIEDNS